MKGVVFTEFLGYVAQRHGEDTVDDIIDASGVASGGAYTSVGTYPHTEMASLCCTLARDTQESPDALICGFGVHLSRTFENNYPDFFSQRENLFDFLASVEDYIHVEVKKLYPDAELPSFRVVARTENRMVLDYRSPRRMSALAHGLILGSAARYGVDARVGHQTPLDGDHDVALFTVDLS